MRKRCDLCGCSQARVHCESDQASLCWSCDLEVHAANFLVEKHVRVLLCGSCSAPSPWKASGACLGSAATVCEVCFRHREAGVGVLSGEEMRGRVDHDVRDESEDGGEEDEAADESEEEEDGENQVVPWAFDAPPPSVDRSSSTGETGDEFGDVCESRMDWTQQIAHSDSTEQECGHSYATSAMTAWATGSSIPSCTDQPRGRGGLRTGQHLFSKGQKEGPNLAMMPTFPTAAIAVSRPG
ncbi:hypothetical protein MLD38_000663 [Melastoma candidum]|uniref:Uncharacterized protein n=1 Tax=Melastoma candidum TaxID=119954 RepID=A0ACB9SBQ1_9MYRT|nr:hypothetical protein MLD38_000663 [Melastoma candidum]